MAITYGLVANSSDVATANQVFVDRTAAAGKLPALPADAFAVPPDVRGIGQAAGAVAQSVGGTQSAAVVQLRAYAGKVTAVFKRLTAAQAAQLTAQQKNANARVHAVRKAQLDTLLTRSGLALAIMALALDRARLAGGRTSAPAGADDELSGAGEYPSGTSMSASRSRDPTTS